MVTNVIFGHVPGVAVGDSFATYLDMNAAGLHRSTMGGIAGTERTGADSVVISGQYADDVDRGDLIVYTGQGGRNESGKHVSDQTLTRGNRALAVNQLKGLPVRVIRGSHRLSDYAPTSGYRYDGLYRVESHWHEKGKAGFNVWRYRLEKIDLATPILPRPDSSSAQQLAGGNSNPSRKTTTVQRVIRDTTQAKKLKERYKYQCQVCDTAIKTAGGLYAEAAHIKPLGEPHNGPDTPDNILCLCPNHHVMFDLGSFSVEDDLSLIGLPGKLRLISEHTLSASNLRYHREHYLSRPK